MNPNDIFLTSDQHYGHDNIIKYSSRPFSCIEEMHEVFIENHNSVVSKTSTVFHLGDFSLSFSAMETILPRLNGIHYLIAGNHDRCFKSLVSGTKSPSLQKYLDAGFKEVHRFYDLDLDGKQIQMSHLPYFDEVRAAKTYDLRYKDFAPVKKHGKEILLHGHLHNIFTTPFYENSINVGVDQWNYYPTRLTDLLSYHAKYLHDALQK